MTPLRLALISIIIGASPVLIALLGSLLANVLNCEQKSGGVSSCYVFGKDISGVLYAMMMAHWLFIFTGGIAVFGIIASLLWAYISFKWAMIIIFAPFTFGLVAAALSYLPILTGFRAVDIELSPNITGILTDNGEPVEGAILVRQLEYGTYADHTTITDENGQFSFPAHSIRSFRPGWFAERRKPTLAKHGIFMRKDNEHINLFSWQSHYTLLQHPISEVLSHLHCELAKEPEQYATDSTVEPLYVSALCNLPAEYIAEYNSRYN